LPFSRETARAELLDGRMDDLAWRKLCQRFPRVPRDFRIEQVREQAGPGQPLAGGHRPVIALAFSPDSTMLASSGGGLIPGAVDIRVFDVASRELRKICRYHWMGVFNLAFDPGTGLLASASHDYSVVLWEIERNEAIFLVGGQDDGISRAAAKFVGTQVIVADGMTFGDERAALTRFDLATGEIRTLFELEGDLGIAHLEVLPQDKLVIAAIDDQRLAGPPSEIRCVALDGTERIRFPLNMCIYDLAAADARTLLATGSFGSEQTKDDEETDNDGQTAVVLLDATSGQIQARRTLGPEIGAYVAGSPDWTRLAVAYDDGVEVCRLPSLEPELRLPVADGRVCSLAWSPDGRWIAVGTLRCSVRLFDATTGIEHLA
jgi:WD40 repeat protein